MKKVTKYVARKNSPITNTQAEVIGFELERMEKEGIHTTARELLDRARDPNSPLHGFFTWDDQKAAELQRLDWARKLISSVTIIEVKTSDRVRAFHNVVTVTPLDKMPMRSYQPRYRVVASDDSTAQVGWGLYQRCASACREARAIGLPEKSAFWREACRVILNRQPEVRPASIEKKKSA